MSERYDAAIIGTGPAGLSAAITLKIRNKNIIVFGGEGISGKVEKAHEIQNYLGIPAVKGEDLAKAYKAHIDSMGIEIQKEQITNVYAMGSYFNLVTRANEIIEASSVILATGVNFGKPYEGEVQFLGRGVSYCATCDAPLYKGKKIAMIGATPKEEEEADFMAEVCEEVYYIPLYKEEPQVKAEIKVIKDTPLAITGAFKATQLALKNQTLDVDGIFILRDAVSPAQLVPGLAMDGNHVATDRKMATNIPGLFACGDITGLPYQYIKSAGEGNVAAISAVGYLAKINKQ